MKKLTEDLVARDRVVRAGGPANTDDLNIFIDDGTQINLFSEHTVIGEQPRPMGTLTSETSMPRLSKRPANAELPAVVVLVQHAFAVVEPEDPQGAGVATARIAREAATKSLENIIV